MITIELLQVPHYGWLPLIKDDDATVYRGEYEPTAHEALERAERFMVVLEERKNELEDDRAYQRHGQAKRI